MHQSTLSAGKSKPFAASAMQPCKGKGRNMPEAMCEKSRFLKFLVNGEETKQIGSMGGRCLHRKLPQSSRSTCLHITQKTTPEFLQHLSVHNTSADYLNKGLLSQGGLLP